MSVFLGRTFSIKIPVLLIIVLLFINATPLKAQLNSYILNDGIRARKDIIDVFFGKKRESWLSSPDYREKKLFFSLMPLSSASSDPGIAVSAINASFYLGDPKNTNLSNITFYPATNFYSYLQFKALPNLWLDANSYNIPGKIELVQVLQDNYGLGTRSSNDSIFVIDYHLVKLYLNGNKAVGKHYFLGVGYNFDRFYKVKDLSDSTYVTPFELYGIGTSSQTLSSGISFNFLFDNRKNSINPLNGSYLNFSIRSNNKWTGSDYNWYSLYFDSRTYITLSNKKHRTLALWGLYWGTWGNVPYLNLPGTGLDYSNWTGRGYWRARYRGKQMLYAEAEYRFDFTERGLWGAVLFANIQSFTEPESKAFKYIAPAVGSGLRLKFNKFSDSNLTFDIAVGKESFNWYFSLNEVF